MKKDLKYRLSPEVGKRNYQSESEKLGDIFFIYIITEGCKEELIYLKKLCELFKVSNDNNDSVKFLNDFYKNPKIAVTDSNPINRMKAMIEVAEGKYESDECWLVCDRDNGSFTDSQYQQLMEQCRDYGVNLIVSNPGFQLWLLLHFTNCLEDLKLHEYNKSSKQIKIIEKELKKYVPDYEHGELDMAYFESHIEDAFSNSFLFCVEIGELKDKIGTNMYELIMSFRDKFGELI